MSLVGTTIDRAVGPGGIEMSSNFFNKVRVAAKIGIPKSRFFA